MTRLAIGEVAIRLKLFGTAAEELGEVVRPPWPRWMERLLATEAIGDERIHRDGEETTLGGALSAVATRLHHRLKLASWAVGAMEELGWHSRVEGENVVMIRLLAPGPALEELELHGILGPVTKICEIGPGGLPRVFERSVE